MEQVNKKNIADQQETDIMSEQEAGRTDTTDEVTADNGIKEDEVQMWKDKYLRLSAEFDNYRKRTLKEKMELVSMGGEDVIKSLLPVLDDMDRALAAVNQNDDIESARTGIHLITMKLKDALAGKGVKEIDCMGSHLDTDLHEAVAKTPCEPDSKGRIVDVVQKGYQMNDKVVRHAKVVVGE